MSFFPSDYHLLHHHMGSLLNAFDGRQSNINDDAYGGGQRSAYGARRYQQPQQHQMPRYHLIDMSTPPEPYYYLTSDLPASRRPSPSPQPAGVADSRPTRGAAGAKYFGGHEDEMKRGEVDHAARPAQPTPTQPQSKAMTANTNHNDGSHADGGDDSDALTQLFQSLFRPSNTSSTDLLGRDIAGLGKLKVDVDEDSTGLTVKAEVAGVPKENVKLIVKDQVLTITAEKKSEHTHEHGSNNAESAQPARPSADTKKQQPAVEITDEPEAHAGKADDSKKDDKQPSASSPSAAPSRRPRAIHRELTYGKVSRSIRLPRNSDLAAITAQHNDGIITVRVPYKQVNEAQEQEIKIQ